MTFFAIGASRDEGVLPFPGARAHARARAGDTDWDTDRLRIRIRIWDSNPDKDTDKDTDWIQADNPRALVSNSRSIDSDLCSHGFPPPRQPRRANDRAPRTANACLYQPISKGRPRAPLCTEPQTVKNPEENTRGAEHRAAEDGTVRNRRPRSDWSPEDTERSEVRRGGTPGRRRRHGAKM